jgi:D-sedoheptulose 7-phosphate isomerase
MIKTFVNEYIDRLKTLLSNIDIKDIEDIVNILKNSSKNNSKIYVIGNGGSLATASHISNDWGVGLKDILNIDIISLCNSSIISAIANDYGYENIFHYQLKDILKKEDTLIAISCSGNSQNIIKACKYAKDIDASIISMTGFDGGELKNLSNISFHIDMQDNNYALIEDMHMILNHIIYSYFKINYKK